MLLAGFGLKYYLLLFCDIPGSAMVFFFFPHINFCVFGVFKNFFVRRGYVYCYVVIVWLYFVGM